MKFLLALGLICSAAMASDLARRPRPIALDSEQAVFADFTKAHFEITYDLEKKIAAASATIELTTAERGYIAFDVQEMPTDITLDNEVDGARLFEVGRTKLLATRRPHNAGNHVLKMKVALKQLVEFNSGGVKSAFWMTDLTDRGYLERYLPTNFLFDRIPTTMLVKFVGAPSKQKVYANGVVEKLSDDEYRITFPDGYNSSCFYFHTTPDNATDELRFTLKSVDQRDLPAVIYVARDGSNNTRRLEDLKARTLTIFNELERDYGPFPHPSLTVYVAGSGGMEYSGATMTSASALGHELYHSYFARGVMPSDGNSGWIDEALASWRDSGYGRSNNLSGSTRMANLGEYNRVTDTQAYSFGARFMAYLDGKTASLGGLKPFLKDTVEKKSFDPMNVAEFIALMDQFYGMSFTADFKKYVFGEGEKTAPVTFQMNPIHKQLTLEELTNLL